MVKEHLNQIEEAAGDWLARRDSDEWSEAEQRRFDQWLNESALHRVAYLRLEHVWERTQRLKALRAGVTSKEVPPPGQWVLSPFFGAVDATPGRARAHLGIALKALAASLLLAVALGTAWYLWPSGSDYRTPVGGLASVPMSDGSKVTLNTNSEIRVAVTEKERDVELEQGEAFFQVAKDPKRPFVVRAGRRRIIAVGTEFSVRREGDDIQVVVTQGQVRLDSAGSAIPVHSEVRDLPRSGAAQIDAGTIARASGSGVLLQQKPLAEAEESLSWREGVLVLHQMTLGEAAAEFNRYNIRKIVIEDPAVASLRVAGSFRANNVDAFVRLLVRGYPLRSEERPDEIVLRSR